MEKPSAALPPRPDISRQRATRRIAMLKFYFNGAPNPNKVALFLEESGLPYEPVPVDTRKGDQFKPEFLAVNPNGKVPAIDDNGVFVFDSNAILLYLADHLANSRYMVGDTYTIVDMALWGWARLAPFVLGDDVFAKYPNVKRLLDEVSARPAATRAIALKDRFTFKADMDEEAKHIMFGHLKTKAACSGSPRGN